MTFKVTFRELMKVITNTVSYVFHNGRVVKERWWHFLCWNRIAFWRIPRSRVLLIDRDKGEVTLVPVRWSWLLLEWVDR
jgi:hypothetical protein